MGQWVAFSRLQISTFASSLLLAMLLPVACLAGTLPPNDQPSTASPVGWRAAAREDILAAYEIFSGHHPGMFDPYNRGFPEQLRRARDSALTFGQNIDDAEGHMLALTRFSAGLADGHAVVRIGYNGNKKPLWPGFRTVWRGDALYVVETSEDSPPRGSALLACDGMNARRLIRDAAFPDGRANEEGQWWTRAPSFFFHAQSPYRTAPVECSFRHPDRRHAVYKLSWRTVPEAVVKGWFRDLRPEPVELSEPRPGILRLNLPTFSPDDQARAAYSQLFRDLETGLSRIAAAKAIVIDLRGNKGGSSSWSQDIAERLWGEAAVTAEMADYFRNTQIWWLADRANIKHFQEASAWMRAEGRPKDADGIAKIATQLQRSVENGKRFYVENYGESLYYAGSNWRPLPGRTKRQSPRQLPPVYIVVDGDCVSACLDSLDVFTRFPSVKLVGAPTSADSEYMDTRFEALPSGRGVVIIPTKIWVRRPRGRGQVYQPDILVKDLDWTTATMLDHVEQDLAQR